MKIKRKTGIAAALLAVFCFLVPALPPGVSANAAEGAKGAAVETSLVSGDKNNYGKYLAQYDGASRPVTELRLPADFVTGSETGAAEEIGGGQSVVLGGGNGWAEWTAAVPETGLYAVSLRYYPLPAKGKDIELSLRIDGELPFEEAARLTLPRIWKDEADENGRTIRRDAGGNDLRPKQQEAPRWADWVATGSDGTYNGPFLFYLTAGEHTLRFAINREKAALGAVTLFNSEPPVSYEALRKSYDAAGYGAAGEYLQIVQAEKPLEKSGSMLYPTSDRSTPATSPSHYSRIRLNTIGAQNWKHPGQWISWEIEAPKDGLYEISFKARQNQIEGLSSYRTLYIDDQVPFAEARDIPFFYDLKWNTVTLGGGREPMPVFLKKGKHILKLEASPGPVAEILKSLSDAVLDLNTIYRKIIMITGTTPDVYRTFYLEDEIPGLLDDLKLIRDRLDALSERVKKITGQKGSQASIIDQVSFTLKTLAADPQDIPSRLEGFKSNIESLGSLILLMSQQPLELDYLVVSSGVKLPDTRAGLWERVKYGVQAFAASFIEDYNSIGETYGGEAVTVWISGGRDQAQVVKSMIDDLFTPQHGVKVNLNLVSTATGTTQSPLIQATLAGKGPDVAMLTPKDTPVNLAMRGALLDLSKFDGFAEIEKRFYPSALIPYRYKGGVYAIPETQNYDVMFFRTDILADLGLEPPQTWDEFYRVLAALQKNNLQAGIPETNALNVGVSAGISQFEKFLLQSGGSYYTEDLSRTAFDTQTAYDAFQSWTELYTKYGLDRQFDFYNRFRTGEMPLGIQPYPVYNQLYQAAPELRGLWSFSPIPGTRRADGGIDRSETAGGNACIILSGCKNAQDAFRYVGWWTGSDVQTRFGNELEAIMGAAARYDTANKEAFENLPWTDQEAGILKRQWESVTDIPQIPGNYFIARCLTTAFRQVVDEKRSPVSTLNSTNKDMNAEITRKRIEFELN